MLLAMIEALGEEDRGIVEKLYTEYSAKVGAIAAKISKDPDSVDDLVNDAFLKVIKYVDRFRDKPPQEQKRMMIIIARSVCFNHMRKKKREAPVFSGCEDPAVTVADPDADILALLVKRETLDELVGEMRSLDPVVRDMILLKYYFDMKSAEIAEFYGVNPSTVRSAISRGTAKLKTRLGEYLNG